VTWAAEESRYLDHGEREEVIMREGRSWSGAAAGRVPAGRRPGGTGIARSPALGDPAPDREPGQKRGLASVFGPVEGHPDGLPHGREENLYPADARR